MTQEERAAGEARMREGATTNDYRRAVSGGEFGSLGYDWTDKPHRLVYDLCGEVDLQRSAKEGAEAMLCEAQAEIAELRKALRPFAEAYRRQGSPTAEYAGLEALAKHFARAAELVPPENT